MSKAKTFPISDMQSWMPTLAANVSRLSYGKVRFKVDAAASTYFATAADLGCTGDLGIDEMKLLNFATTKAKAEGFVLAMDRTGARQEPRFIDARQLHGDVLLGAECTRSEPR